MGLKNLDLTDNSCWIIIGYSFFIQLHYSWTSTTGMNLEDKCGRDLLNLKHNGLTCISLCALPQNNQNRTIPSLHDQQGNKRMTNQPCIGDPVSPNVKNVTTFKTSFSIVPPTIIQLSAKDDIVSVLSKINNRSCQYMSSLYCCWRVGRQLMNN